MSKNWEFEYRPFYLTLLKSLGITCQGMSRKHDNSFTRELAGCSKRLYWNVLEKILYKSQKTCFDKLDENWTDGTYDPSSPIFVFWYQGIETAPPIVKACYNSLMRHSRNRNVVVVDETSIRSLIELPDYIYEKVSNGVISLTHFSDIIRFSLLEKYGGLWLDATILVSKDISAELFEYPYYTYKIIAPLRYYKVYLGTGKWCGFCCGGYRGSSLFKAMRDLFLDYWKSNNFLIDYFLIDLYMDMLYQKNRRVMQLIDNTNTIPRGEMFFLEKFFYEDYNDKIKQQYLEKNLTFNKLTYKFKTKPSPDCVLSKIIMTDGTCFEYSKNESR